MLKSKIDKTINLVVPFKSGFTETRLVYKSHNYVSGYVSSHSGCKMACKFCHLTQQKQTSFDHVDSDGFSNQVRQIVAYWIENRKEQILEQSHVKRMNINFMARGEPLANKFILADYPRIYEKMKLEVEPTGLVMKPNISTIMPLVIKDYKLDDIFPHSDQVNLYYSLYSHLPTFRKEWLPNAMPLLTALDKLREFKTKNPITFHWTLIKGENDNINDIKELSGILREYAFPNAKLNIVRFNAFDSIYVESDRINEIFQILNEALGNNPKSYIVPRVGKDVFASCGMFAPV